MPLKNKNTLLQALILLFWILILIRTITGEGFQTSGMLILTILPLLFIAHVLFKKPSKKSSLFGKILIFGGILGLATLLVEKGRDIANLEALIRTSATLTGLYLERISPHKKLKKFMFLAIATKIELIGITALITILQENQATTFIEPFYWYLIIFLMAISVPTLALERLQFYRILVGTTTFVSIVLIGDLLISSASVSATILSFLLVLWPAITARILGRKVFF